MTRQSKTPRQRAEETLAAAQRRVDRLTKDVAKRRAEFDLLEADWREAQSRREYASQDPALDQSITQPTGDTA